MFILRLMLLVVSFSFFHCPAPVIGNPQAPGRPGFATATGFGSAPAPVPASAPGDPPFNFPNNPESRMLFPATIDSQQGQLMPGLMSKKRWFWPWGLGLGVAASGFISFFIAYCYGWDKFRSYSEHPAFRLFTSFFCTGTGFLGGVALFEILGFKGFDRLISANEPMAGETVSHQALTDGRFSMDVITRPLYSNRREAQRIYDNQRRIPLWSYIVTGISSGVFLAYSLAFWIGWGLSKHFVYDYVFGLFFFLICINGGFWCGWLLKNFLSNCAYRP